jgi:hypothetical protein
MTVSTNLQPAALHRRTLQHADNRVCILNQSRSQTNTNGIALLDSNKEAGVFHLVVTRIAPASAAAR